MARQGLTITLRITGVRESLAALRKLPRDASDELRKASLRLSQTLATRVQAAARADSGQSALMAPTVRARRDRVPSIVAGGAKRVGSRRKPAYKILFGSEFGASQSGRYGLPQFRPHLGRGSYWFFKTVEDNEFTISQEWRRSADAVVAAFSRGGD